MGLQNLSDDVVLVTLAKEPEINDQLQEINSCQGGTHDVIVDFSHAEILTSEILNSLVILQRALEGSQRRLVLCAVPPEIRQIFWRTGLETLFEFADDDLAAVKSLRCTPYLEG
jgi:anti-anti-sigma regulatory factor